MVSVKTKRQNIKRKNSRRVTQGSAIRLAGTGETQALGGGKAGTTARN